MEQKSLAGAEYRRRKTFSGLGKPGGNGSHRQGSLREFTHRAASETYLVTRLAITLLKLLGYVGITSLPLFCLPHGVVNFCRREIAHGSRNLAVHSALC